MTLVVERTDLAGLRRNASEAKRMQVGRSSGWCLRYGSTGWSPRSPTETLPTRHRAVRPRIPLRRSGGRRAFLQLACVATGRDLEGVTATLVAAFEHDPLGISDRPRARAGAEASRIVLTGIRIAVW